MLGVLDDDAADIEQALEEFPERFVVLLEGEEDLVGLDFFVGKVEDTDDDVADWVVKGDGGGEALDVERADSGGAVDDGPFESVGKLGGDVVDGLDIGDPFGEDGGEDGRGAVTGAESRIEGQTVEARAGGQQGGRVGTARVHGMGGLEI